MTSPSQEIREFQPKRNTNKYIPKTTQNAQEFKPKQINSQQTQKPNNPPPPPVRHNAFNFGIAPQNSSNKNKSTVNNNQNISWQNHDYKPKVPAPEGVPNPQPRKIDPNYEPQLKPEEIIPGNSPRQFSINPSLIVQKK